MNQRRSGKRWVLGTTVVGLAGWSTAAASDPGALPALHDAAVRSAVEAGVADGPVQTFAHENVLGTSMELLVGQCSRAQGLWAQHAAIAEIDRLCAILSTRDPRSAISAHMKGQPASAPEIRQLLSLYEAWSARTRGAISAYLGGTIELWRSAQETGRLPAADALRGATESPELARLNVDALGKAFVIERAVAAARQFAPVGLLNIGGDIRAWGDLAWRIGVADPRCPAENDAPLATFDLREGAVATSGGYLRNFTVAGEKFSHVIDGRTGQAAYWRRAATIVADDCVTANAVSTACCVLGAAESSCLLDDPQIRGFLLPDEAGEIRGGGAIEQTAGGALMAQPAAVAAGQWPSGYAVNVNVTLKNTGGGRKFKRPYVAIWVEDAKGKAIRTITLWGAKEKYLREMTNWWQATGGDRKAIASVSRASRQAGQYSVAWDGTDDKGAPVPRGQYTVVMEINREHGRHVVERARLDCADKIAKAAFRATPESDESAVEYGPKGK